ncbi:LexA family transcriptional regulator [Halomonas sp. HAL1]|uniref:LexA family protein n=1 Tax=Halomonas sp. HAL1 TaxID=550984 RepID=UPI00022D26D5|nr:S24 family peptidase [Halomonas sp. HAL1]EHA16107.1 putative prophage repressor [Halomonas sp. HAL1]WKV93726.1 S24 family peptidase [Halomonas sp. HAL1]
MTISMAASTVKPNHLRSVPRTYAPTPSITRRNTYALKVRGNAMRDCNLFDGDVIIIRRYQHDAQTETAVAEINQQKIVLKQLSISRFGVELWPEDTLQPALFLHNRDIQVLGMVMGVESHPRAGLQNKPTITEH